MKAVGLLSGGLDSTLAIRMMLDQDVEVVAFNMVTMFCCCTPKDASCSAARSAVRQLGIELEVINTTDEFLPIVADPPHGHGSGMNPCLDCRIMLFRKARAHMEKTGASFIVTGEVLGQRPMSQRRDAMRLIDRESGLTGYVLRPLSAGLLPPTVPEERGWVDREKLLAVSGRTRRPQMALAEDMGIRDYPCPAGGCLLTDPIFSERVRDLLEHEGTLLKEDMKLLKVGRHFRLGPKSKAIVGRDEDENGQLLTGVGPADLVFEIDGQPGPFTLLRGASSESEIEEAAALTSRYGKSGGSEPTTVICRRPGGVETSHVVGPVDRALLRGMMIGGSR